MEPGVDMDEWEAQDAALEALFEAHPELRPTLAETAVALAELTHSSLAEDRL